MFKWDHMVGEEVKTHKQNPTEPIRTPMIAGGLFAIQKKWFYTLGTYDMKMEVWGGENLGR